MALFLGAVAGCHNNYEMPTPKPTLSIPNPSLGVTLRTSPAALRQMDPAVFTIRLTDAHSRPVDGASVTADLVMPAMDMGRNPVVVHPQGSGIYTGTGRFSMDGEWNVVVTATLGPEKTLRVFSRHVR